MPTNKKKTTDMGWGLTDTLWLYTVLPEPLLSSELERISGARSIGDTDVVTFQPCREHASQDRYVVEDWALPGGTWSFRGIFDGHAGEETVDYTVATLPGIIKSTLTVILENDNQPSPSVVSDLLTDSISKFDEAIGQALVDLFPDASSLESMSDEDIQKVVNDDGHNSNIVLRCMRGTTALIAITDPLKSNIWVASLGDCAAILGTKEESGQWSTRVLSSAHNGENAAAAKDVADAHPGEPEVMLDNRVLGAIAVTRAIGDFSFKLPPEYTNRVFLNSQPGFVSPEKVRSFIGRNLTPPYMSGVPDIQHLDMTSISGEKFLIMCSDGMMDVYDNDRLKLREVLSPRWVEIVGKQYGDPKTKNLALSLLRDAMGGDNTDNVSRMITVEMSFSWIDDTTVLVQRL